MAVSAFGTSPRCAAPCLTRAKGIPRATTEDAQPGAAPPECVVPLLPHPIPSWEVGNGKDLSVGRQECPSQPCHPLPHSALLQGDAPSPGEALREKDTAGDGFLDVWFCWSGRKSDSLHPS